eukprot:309035_1
MPSIELMDNECCKTIVEDMKNIINHRIAIQFQWTSPESISFQLISIKGLLDHYANQMTTVGLKTQIEDKLRSIKVHCSKIRKYKMKSRLDVPIKLVETSKNIVYGFIRQVEKKHQLLFIPNTVCNVCCMFYDCFIEIPPEEASPFAILFAMFDLQPALLIKGWTLLNPDKQCQYLEDKIINTVERQEQLTNDLIKKVYDFSDVTSVTKTMVEDNIKEMFSKYGQKRSSVEYIVNWTG